MAGVEHWVRGPQWFSGCLPSICPVPSWPGASANPKTDGLSAVASVTLGLTGSALGETVGLKESHLGLDTPPPPVSFPEGL